MLRLGLWILGLGLFILVLGTVLNWFSDTAAVAQKEFGTSALLKKYEWFKDQASAIQKKRADITYYEGAIKEETDREEKRMLRAELRGIVTVHNQLVSEYNAQMSKFNYRFTNKGDLPQSNLDPLPREFQEYIIH